MSLDFSLYYICDEHNIEVFTKNITHNLNIMAKKANIYKLLWRPNENYYIFANDIIIELEIGLNKLKNNQKYFSKYNSKNGWGTYPNFVKFVEDVLEACKEYPNATIGVSI